MARPTEIHYPFPPIDMLDKSDIAKFVSTRPISTAEFNFKDPLIREHPSVELLFRRHLILQGEELPKGRGRIAAFYDLDKTLQMDYQSIEERRLATVNGQPEALFHLYVGRLAIDRTNGRQMCLTLRYTPSQSQTLHYDFWSQPNMSLRVLVPPQRQVNQPLDEKASYLIDFVRRFGVKV